MSATNRGAKRAGHDNYPTPAYAVRRLLEAVPIPGGRWLEPGAGSGAIIRAVNERRQDVAWTAVEVRKRACARLAQLPCVEVLHRNLLRGVEGTWDVCLGNPAYRIAQEVVDFGRAHAHLVCLLLRLNFLGSRKRREWWKRNPASIYVLPDRPSFNGKGTDATEYAWFCWREGQREATWDVLELTPQAEKRRAA